VKTERLSVAAESAQSALRRTSSTAQPAVRPGQRLGRTKFVDSWDRMAWARPVGGWTTLRREVALTVLPAAVTRTWNSCGVLRRKRAAAALDDANILAIHDVGTQDGRPFVVAKATRRPYGPRPMGRDPISPKEVVAYERQIAQGLAAATPRGIVHRDLKPRTPFIQD
jgi:serine/threonine protein kinase